MPVKHGKSGPQASSQRLSLRQRAKACRRPAGKSIGWSRRSPQVKAPDTNR